MDKFLTQFLGTTDVPTYLAAFAFALIGAIISLRWQARKRDKLSDSTPYKFSWWFLIRDNFMQLITGILLTFIAFRFSNEIYGEQLTMKLAFLVGLGFNELAGVIDRWKTNARKDKP